MTLLFWLFIWLLVGFIAYATLLWAVTREDGEVTIEEGVKFARFILFGPISLVIVAFIIGSVYLDKHGSKPLFKRKK